MFSGNECSALADFLTLPNTGFLSDPRLAVNTVLVLEAVHGTAIKPENDHLLTWEDRSATLRTDVLGDGNDVFWEEEHAVYRPANLIAVAIKALSINPSITGQRLTKYSTNLPNLHIVQRGFPQSPDSRSGHPYQSIFIVSPSVQVS